MTAKLLPGETKAAPIGLAKHSYFNLSSHNSPNCILDHVLCLPNCWRYTPVDRTLISTREVQQVDTVNKGSERAMDFKSGRGRDLLTALVTYGTDIVGLGFDDAARNVSNI